MQNPAYTGEISPNASLNGVSAKAVLAGAVATVSISLVLFSLGSGLGLAAFTPNASDTESAFSFTAKIATWMIVTQWLSSALGGYLAGRLRPREIGYHTDEVFFRDTAHGFVTWALATIFTACIVTSMAAGAAQGGAKAALGAGMMHRDRPSVSGPLDGALDPLVRSSQGPASPELRMETARIFMKGDAVSDADRNYLISGVAARTGVSTDEATARVDQSIAEIATAKQQAKEAADKARKAASAMAITTALSMMIGAFIASIAGALGGRQRDCDSALCDKTVR
jgi:hypothetical protein